MFIKIRANFFAYVRGLGSDPLNPPLRIVTGDCNALFWIESGLQRVADRRSRLGPQFTMNFEYKIDHISKTKNRKNLKINFEFVSEQCYLLG